MKNLLLALLLISPCAARAQRGGPPERDSLELLSDYSDRSGLGARTAGFKSSSALGRAGGYALSLSAEAAHRRGWDSESFPGELYEVSTRLRASSRAWSFATGVRSNSDRPFNSPAETDLSLDASRPIGGSGPHRFIFGVTYSSRRSFLRGVPIPYVSYSYNSEKLSIFLPFMLLWKPAPGTELTASYLPPRYFSLALSRRLSEKFKLGVSGGVRLSQYLISGRADKDQSLFLEQPRADLQASYSPAKGWETGLTAGWGFRARYFTGDSYDDHHAVTGTGTGPLLGFSVKRVF